MVKTRKTNIAEYKLEPSFHKVHKEEQVDSHFGLDHSTELIEGGFGLYSSVGVKPKIGAIKSEFYRIGLTIRGSVQVDCGLESFELKPGSIVFTFPGQVFSLHDKSDDLFAYYMLFKEDFISDALSLRNIQEQFQFLNYSGTQVFRLEQGDFDAIQDYIQKINVEIKSRRSGIRQFIQLYINLILLQANRSYENLKTDKSAASSPDKQMLVNYKKLVSKHFVHKRKVADYADMLHLSADRLNKIIKSQSGKTAHELIDEMILIEAKAQLMHTPLAVSEIAYQLNFTDPSHFNKFFKKLTGVTPLQFRSKT